MTHYVDLQEDCNKEKLLFFLLDFLLYARIQCHVCLCAFLFLELDLETVFAMHKFLKMFAALVVGRKVLLDEWGGSSHILK